LDCPRRYYLSYIRSLKEAKLPSLERDERDMGVLLHVVLDEIYKDKNAFFKEMELKESIREKLHQRSKNSQLFRYHADLWLERLSDFIKHEVERFESGCRVFHTEKKYSCEYLGFKITGRIDRVDIREGRYEVLDYKSGKVEIAKKIDSKKISDFQLQFYEILTKANSMDVESFGYYDLRNAKIITEDFKDEKMELLNSKLIELSKQKEIDFHMCDDLKNCRYCPYNYLCNRSA
jgi:RecB family exonuclease